MGESSGSQAFIGIGKEAAETPGEAVEPTVFFAFSSETMGQAIDREESEGIAGTRGRAKLRSVQTLKKPGGGFSVEGLKAENLPLLLELGLGAFSGSVLGSGTLTETLSSFTVVVYKNVKKFTYAGCKIGRLRFSSSKSAQLLKLDVEDIVAMTGTPDDKGALAPSYLETQRPLVHRDSILKIDSTPTPVEELTFEIENTLDAELFRNSQTRLAVPEEDRKVSGNLVVSWNTATYASGLAKFLSGETAEVEGYWTDGTNTLKVIFPYVYFTGETPKVGGRGVMTLPLPFEAKDAADGANDSMQVILS